MPTSVNKRILKGVHKHMYRNYTHGSDVKILIKSYAVEFSHWQVARLLDFWEPGYTCELQNEQITHIPIFRYTFQEFQFAISLSHR